MSIKLKKIDGRYFVSNIGTMHEYIEWLEEKIKGEEL